MTTSRTDRLYGVHPILEALKSQDRQFEEIYLQQGRKGRDVTEVLRLARSQRVVVDFRPREALDRMAGTAHHQGIVGIIAAKRYTAFDDLLAAVKGQEDALLVMLDGIEDPQNLGAILRAAEGAGIDAVIIPERRAIGVTPTVAKVSAGAVEHVPVVRVVNLSQTIDRLKDAGFWVYALDPKGADNYLDVDYRRRLVLVIGGEGRGIRPLVAEHCDGRLSIPMKGRVSSLNASVAAGILFYEVLRQRAEPRTVKPVGSE